MVHAVHWPLRGRTAGYSCILRLCPWLCQQIHPREEGTCSAAEAAPLLPLHLRSLLTAARNAAARTVELRRRTVTVIDVTRLVLLVRCAARGRGQQYGPPRRLRRRGRGRRAAGAAADRRRAGGLRGRPTW